MTKKATYQHTFQSTRPRGARPLIRQMVIAVAKFQSTRPRGARRIPNLPAILADIFQSTRPRGARRKQFVKVRYDKKFQSTRPRGARPATLHIWRGFTTFQSTRPRGARLGVFVLLVPRGFISIHVPAWGATVGVEVFVALDGFQSTRPRGARLLQIIMNGGIAAFQSTRPRGARPCPHHGQTFTDHFNPRARVGRDSGASCCLRRVRYFNPRARVGRDLMPSSAAILRMISIHAPAWGATLSSLPPILDDKISIHAPAWGATLALLVHAFFRKFQSTRPRGARR